MRNTILFLTVLLFAPGAAFVSCSSDNDYNKELILTVASKALLNTGYESSHAYYVKPKGVVDWMPFESISGFDYEEGYEYIIRVSQEKWHDGEVQDAGIYKYAFLRLISKTKKNSENIPAQRFFLSIASKNVTDSEVSGHPYYAKMTGDNWTTFPEIEGFDYTPGYEYVLLIDRKFNDNSTEYYSYVETYEQMLKESEGLPD